MQLVSTLADTVLLGVISLLERQMYSGKNIDCAIDSKFDVSILSECLYPGRELGCRNTKLDNFLRT